MSSKLRDEALPFQILADDAESAMSFCTRALVANGVSLGWLRRQAGIGDGIALTRKHSARLGAILGVDPLWMSQRQLERDSSTDDPSWLFMRTRFNSRNFIRQAHLQLCPACVHRDGISKWVHDVAMVVACARHQVILQDRCAWCQTLVDWNMPGLGVCRCGRLFRSDACQTASAALINVADLLELRMKGDSVESHPALATLPDFLRPLSVNGLLTILHAFGALERPYQASPSSTGVRRYATDEWVQILRRALERLGAMKALPRNQWVTLSPLVSQGILARLTRSSASAEDVQVGRILGSRVFGRSQPSSRLVQTSQLELFEEDVS